MNVIGKLFVIHKHWLRKDGPGKRQFYPTDQMDAARERALQYSDEKDEDFLIVSVVEEIRRPTQRAADVCQECGTIIVLSSKFCSECGTRR